ncbi:glycosyltransferase [Pseudactinotalea terrae]|uniref:glycosyltransferase n=1 Tax=Pseudactinotalea terrae TaxID=1743262 RepID=UPI0012E1C6F4|nr:glycosyltransferase [Pseudactinotalea terrae]
MTGQAQRARYVGFANAKLPDSDYRVSFARDSLVSDVLLALPERPHALPAEKYVPLPIGEGLRPTTLVALLRVPSILRRSRADIAHFFATQLALAGPPLARLAGTRAIMTITGLGRTFSRPGWLGALLRAIYMACFRLAAACSERVLFQTEADMRELATRVPAHVARHFELVGSAIDGTLFELEVVKPEGRPICIMVARVHPSKGISDFLAVADALAGLADFTLVGPPSAGADGLLAAVNEAADAGKIDYLGTLHDWEVRKLLARAAVLVLPSRGEGIPRVVLEASLSDVATIAYDIAGCRATLPPQALAPAFELDGLQALVERALSDLRFRRDLARDSRAVAVDVYSAQGYADKMDSIIAQVLEPVR